MARKCALCMRGRALHMVKGFNSDLDEYVCGRCYLELKEAEDEDA